jgi:DNA-binding protein Alba
VSISHKKPVAVSLFTTDDTRRQPKGKLYFKWELSQVRGLTLTGKLLVGKKPVMSDVLSVLVTFESGYKEVTVIAYGKEHIKNLIYVIEILRNRFLQDLQVKNIKLFKSLFKDSQDREVGVPTLEIVIESASSSTRHRSAPSETREKASEVGKHSGEA